MKAKVEFDLSILKKNIKDIKSKTKNINFLFPVKCCNNKEVLEIINDNKFGYDISNLNELKIIKNYINNQFISVSGPLSYELKKFKYNNLHIVSNNLSNYKDGNGIRVNFNSNDNFGYSRFGIDYKSLNEEFKNKITYVHLHNSDHRDLNKCKNIYKEIETIIKSFPNLKMLNIGGHLEDLTFDEGIEYLNKVRDIVPNNIDLYVELGDFLFKNTGTLYSQVVDVRYDNKVQVVTLNFSKMANQRWAYPVYASDDDKKVDTIFYGCSCCETDTYLETKAKLFKVGDIVTFKNISPYSFQWNTSFNGVKKMPYYFKK